MKIGANQVRNSIPAARRVRAELGTWLPQSAVAARLHISRREVDRCELSGLAKVCVAFQREGSR